MMESVVTQTSRQIQVVIPQPKVGEGEQESLVRSLHGKSFPPEQWEQLLPILTQMDQLIGLQQVKKSMLELLAMLQVNRWRQQAGLRADRHVLHMVFRGNPGTGKTTMARLVGKLLARMGILDLGHVIEAERADLVGEYIGHTAQKTRDKIREALGGVLFIDEAYALARGGEKDFGKEAIDTLVKGMEDFRERFVLILAGYSKEMEYFMACNPGLSSRFSIQIDFADYSVEELLEIARFMAKEREYELLPTTEVKLRRTLRQQKQQDPYFSNARYIRNLLEGAFRKQAVRLLQGNYPPMEELKRIRSEDLP
ncbi:AAA family ATPase [Rubeoparvulum massiliense]|uniref:AAA family ATPase n=1 Tax=Rubeoparvulum massiliense TaxID=1631346 RepID=UPI00065E93DD|nr:AAA family ATPase [Rubeoparvulum massiliense]